MNALLSIPRNAILVDTGFLVALFNPREPQHLSARNFLQQCHSPLITVEAVVVKTCFFLSDSQRHAFLTAITAQALQVIPTDTSAHSRIATLFQKYQDQEPDYADMALIWLAETTDIASILTLDIQDFSRYRIRGRKFFSLLEWIGI